MAQMEESTVGGGSVSILRRKARTLISRTYLTVAERCFGILGHLVDWVILNVIHGGAGRKCVEDGGVVMVGEP